MVKFHENFLVDKQGQKVGVFLEMNEYEKILHDLVPRNI